MSRALAIAVLLAYAVLLVPVSLGIELVGGHGWQIAFIPVALAGGVRLQLWVQRRRR